jgi:pectate lyase
MTRLPASRVGSAVLAAVLVTGAAWVEGEPLPSFPGAEGFGAVAKGGRGGRVIKVTTLRPDGPGSLQAACRERGPRVIVFDVSAAVEEYCNELAAQRVVEAANR